MKTVVFVLVLLAGFKLGHIATRDVITRAAQACQKDGRSASLGLAPQAWTQSTSVKLVIGNNSLDVYQWQVDSGMWNARYRNPLLVLSAGSRTGQVYCQYDIVNAAASVHRM